MMSLMSLMGHQTRREQNGNSGSKVVLISPQPDQEGNKLQRQKILSFIQPILFIIIIGGILVLFIYIYITILASNEIFSGVLISPQPDQEGNKLQRQENLSFIYPIYNHNWRNISTIYLYIYIYIYNKTSIQRNILRGADKSLVRPGRKQATATEDFDLHTSYLLS